MSIIALYRKNGGEVLGISVDSNAYIGIDPTYFGSIVDPTVLNGADLITPKHYDGVTTIRNATANEITTSAAATLTDINLQQRDLAIFRLQTDPVLRKVLRAIVSIMVTQLNLIRSHVDSTASPASPLSQITQNQAVTAIVNAINAGTFD